MKAEKTRHRTGGAPAAEHRKRVLVVDDEDNYLSLLSKTLTKEGYRVETASGGAGALQIVRTTPCDLALIDLKMSPMTGLELLEAMREVTPTTKILIYTAYPSPETSKLSYLKGALAYLPKPLDLEDLKDRVAQALRASGNKDVEGGLS